jgi:hypothetical protein
LEHANFTVLTAAIAGEAILLIETFRQGRDSSRIGTD